MKIVFHSAYWGYRGTEVALYDYAHHAEKILGAESAILVSREKACPWRAFGGKVSSKVPRVTEYGSWPEAEEILGAERADMLYTIKNGFFDGVVSARTKTAFMPSFRKRTFTGTGTLICLPGWPIPWWAGRALDPIHGGPSAAG